MSTSSLTRETRDFPMGVSARQAIEARVLEAQAELRRESGQRKAGAHSDEQVRLQVKSTEPVRTGPHAVDS